MKQTQQSFLPPYGERRIGYINWIGMWTLYKKEIWRFLKVFFQTVIAPALTALIFLLIFTLAFGRTRQIAGGTDFAVFLAPGLIMMGILQNSFANSSSSLVIAKMQGNVVDFLLPPLGPGELTFAFAMGAVTRGLVVALTTILLMLPFLPLGVFYIWPIVTFAILGSLFMALCGILTGIWAEKIDHMAAVTSFVIMPLTFLSGTFYAISQLPPVWQSISSMNPFFYAIDGFRYGFLGRHDSVNPWVGVFYLGVLCLILLIACRQAFHTGWKIKS